MRRAHGLRLRRSLRYRLRLRFGLGFRFRRRLRFRLRLRRRLRLRLRLGHSYGLWRRLSCFLNSLNWFWLYGRFMRCFWLWLWLWLWSSLKYCLRRLNYRLFRLCLINFATIFNNCLKPLIQL